jgi:hypothetical protein
MTRLGSQFPRVCFKNLASSSEKSGAELAHKLADRLREKAGPVGIKKWPLATWALKLEVGGKPFTAGLSKAKKRENEWILMVGPSDAGPSLLEFLGWQRAGAPSQELMQACREVHAVLTGSSDISAVRWYFIRPNNKPTAVLSPDELPWRRV